MLFFGLLLNSLGVEKWKYSLNRLKKKNNSFFVIFRLDSIFIYSVYWNKNYKTK